MSCDCPLIARLRHAAKDRAEIAPVIAVLLEAADEIERLQAIGGPTEADHVLEARSRLLLDVEGTILAYWTDIPEAELGRLRLAIREALGDYEPKAAA